MVTATVATAATAATRLEAHNGFYFTQPDNVVMFDEVLSQTAKVVYCNLLSHVKKGTNKCKLYISTIAEEVKKSVRTVRRALSQLCERGVIMRLMQYGNKQNQLASLFVIIGKNAACYQESRHKSVVRQSDPAEVNNEADNVNARKKDTVKTAIASTNQGLSSGTKMASPRGTKTVAKVKTGEETRTGTKLEAKAGTKTASLPKVSAPHAKNGIQNNDKEDNENLLKDTLIGQAELPKSSSSSSSLKKIRNSDNDAQILIDFDEQEDQELHVTQKIQETQYHQENSNQEECLTDLPVVKRPNESDENKADEHSNSEIVSKASDKTDDAETVIETVTETTIESVITPEAASEDLPLPEEVESSDADSADSNSTFDPLVCVQDADKIPNDMLDTARYFLYRTGRDPRSINEKEIQAMREVFVKHYPARIQKEIDVACRRFIKNGKSLKMLFFGYIATALRKQQSLVPFDKKTAGRSAGKSVVQPAEKPTGKSAQKLAKQGEDGNIESVKDTKSFEEASSVQTIQTGCTSDASYVSDATCTGRNNRYLTSEDISDKTNPLSSMSMEELLALEKELDDKMKKS